jgi:cold shock CspA family protein
MISAIARTVPEKGFGFIRAVPKDYFLHVSGLVNRDEWDSLQMNDRCAFEPKLEGEGWRATNVRVLRF